MEYISRNCPYAIPKKANSAAAGIPKGLSPSGIQTAKKTQKGHTIPFSHYSNIDFNIKNRVCQLFESIFSKLLLQTEVFLLKTAEKSSYKPLNPSMAESGALQKTFRIIFPKG
ncbi:MAG: hypothetical protein ACLR06_13885 [Christensenellaceae bacterium]